jgi:Cu-processing system permease protein
MQFGASSAKASISLLNVILFIVPAVSILYSTTYWYNAESYTSLVLTQPVRRTAVYLASCFAISIGLAGSFVVSSAAAAFLFGSFDVRIAVLLISGALLTFIFVALGQLLAVTVTDKMKGIGIAFLVWIYFAILHDEIDFTLMSTLTENTIEFPSMVLMAINRSYLVRVSVLLKTESGAMMGYTGQALQQTLSNATGLFLTSVMLLVWTLLPVTLGIRKFKAKDI